MSLLGRNGNIIRPKIGHQRSFGKLTTQIDGKSVTITSIGDVEHDQGSDGMNAKHAESDAFKRCAMKVGLGLHLWAGEEYYLDKKLSEAEGKKNIKLQSA